MTPTRIILLSATLIVNTATHAGLHGLTHHSRANCFGFNESVSWWKGHNFKAYVVSEHFKYGNEEDTSRPGSYHTIRTIPGITWRHAAFHSHEGYSPLTNYLVKGWHYMYDESNRPSLVMISPARNCSAYDGWWD